MHFKKRSSKVEKQVFFNGVTREAKGNLFGVKA
jgi:hypothetical protein